MSIHRASWLLNLALATVLIGSACDDDANTIDGPSPHGATYVNEAAFVTPPQVQPVVIAGASCPDPKFVAPFTLIISGGVSDLFLTRVDMQFVDRIGVTTPMLSISRAALIERFGSTRITALETRTFPLEFPFGCTGVLSGTLTITAVVDDSRQRERLMSTQVRVG